jgi:hypothetical protein
VAFLVRAGLRYNRWVDTEGRRAPDYPADVITDLGTKGDMLSVFAVTDDVTAERIAAAVAAGKQSLQETGYAVFDQAGLVALGISLQKNPGGTADAVVNGSHYDLAVGTAARLLSLAEAVAAGEIVPILKQDVERLLRAGLKSAQLDGNRMQPSLREKLQ